MKQRRVVCAANRCHTDHTILILGARHFDTLMRKTIKMLGMTHLDFHPEDQGFIDNFGVWMTRKEARDLAIETDQRLYRCGGDRYNLYSENLY